MKKILVLMVCLILFFACKKQDLENIEILADLDFIKKYEYKGREEYITYIPKYKVEEPYWAEIVVDDSAKIIPKSKVSKYSLALPAFRYCKNPFSQIISAAVIFDDERVNLPYRCIDAPKTCIDINNCGINDDAHYMYCDAHCVSEPSQDLAKKIFDSKKYYIEIGFKMKNNAKHIKGRWFFGDWQKE